ncbi:MarR family winged helix-turn-helix transcriptional regulator [Marimonas sp. MJW-29]|uniref:MarR family winged helix-turn-helix transcriptional regulator n=1 Tax=Sulfitobacter sediminis TaxID=3234186 RepID=A0ABV3RH14_9RHOB
MNREMTEGFQKAAPVGKHPPVGGIEDVITFRLNVLVSIGERAGQQWSEKMFGLSLNEWRVLALVKARGPCRASDIADLLFMDKSQASRVIKALLKAGLVQNLPDPNDGRAVALRATAKGEKLYGEVMAEVLRSNERILAPLSREEVEAFSSTLDKLIAHSRDLLEVRLGRQIAR